MAANKKINFDKYFQKIRQWVLDLKGDPQFLDKIKTIVLGYMIGFSLLYAGYTLAIEPIQKQYAQATKEYLAKEEQPAAKEHSTSVIITEILTNEYIKLQKQSEKLQIQVDIMQLQNNLSDKTWQNISNEQTFFQVVLALLPTSPTSIDKGMAQLNQLAPIDNDGYKIFPVTIDGQASYDGLLTYFKYLENRSEIGVFDKFTISSSNNTKPITGLDFNVQVGRIQIDKLL